MNITISKEKVEVEYFKKGYLEDISTELSDMYNQKALFQNSKTKNWKLIMLSK